MIVYNNLPCCIIKILHIILSSTVYRHSILMPSTKITAENQTGLYPAD